MSVPRSYLLPLSAIQKHRPPETCPIKRFLPSGESSSQRPRPPGFEVRMRTLATPQPRLPSRERLSLHPWISLTCNSAFWSGPHFFVFFVKFILEAEREREGEVDLLFHLVVHSLVSSWICSWQDIKPATSAYRDYAVTNRATRLGLWTSFLHPACHVSGIVLDTGMVPPDLLRSFRAVVFCLYDPSAW